MRPRRKDPPAGCGDVSENIKKEQKQNTTKTKKNKKQNSKGDVRRDDSQGRFLAQHSVAILFGL